MLRRDISRRFIIIINSNVQAAVGMACKRLNFVLAILRFLSGDAGQHTLPCIMATNDRVSRDTKIFTKHIKLQLNSFNYSKLKYIHQQQDR